MKAAGNVNADEIDTKSNGSNQIAIMTRYYIYDRPEHVREVDRQKWTKWIVNGNGAAKHNWVGMVQVVTTLPGAGKRDWAGMAHAVTTALGPGRYIWKPGLSVCSVVDLDGGDVENPQVCDGGLEQGEAMHARVLASVRRRCKEREKTGQESEKKSTIGSQMSLAVRKGIVRPIGFTHCRRPLRHAAFLRTYIGARFAT